MAEQKGIKGKNKRNDWALPSCCGGPGSSHSRVLSIVLRASLRPTMCARGAFGGAGKVGYHQGRGSQWTLPRSGGKGGADLPAPVVD